MIFKHTQLEFYFGKANTCFKQRHRFCFDENSPVVLVIASSKKLCLNLRLVDYLATLLRNIIFGSKLMFIYS